MGRDIADMVQSAFKPVHFPAMIAHLGTDGQQPSSCTKALFLRVWAGMGRNRSKEAQTAGTAAIIGILEQIPDKKEQFISKYCMQMLSLFGTNFRYKIFIFMQKREQKVLFLPVWAGMGRNDAKSRPKI